MKELEEQITRGGNKEMRREAERVKIGFFNLNEEGWKFSTLVPWTVEDMNINISVLEILSHFTLLFKEDILRYSKITHLLEAVPECDCDHKRRNFCR